jgi:hypothetical protein
MARLPVLKRRRSKTQQALDLAKSVATAWTAINVSSASARAAKKGAKAYGAAKGAKVVGRPLVKVAAIPVAVGGGVVVWRKLKKDSDSGTGAHTDVGGTAGPVATSKTVSPPETARSDAS